MTAGYGQAGSPSLDKYSSAVIITKVFGFYVEA